MYDTTKPYIGRIKEIVGRTQEGKTFPPSSTDGIGEKGIYHWQHRTFRSVVIDALEMNFTDMAVMRAKVKYLQNHIMVPKEDEEAILQVVETLSDECVKRDVVITSGETAVHESHKGIEISVSVQGEYVAKKENRFQRGDYLVGIGSNGLHSNGFTRIREVFGDEFREEFVRPTLGYYNTIINLLNRNVEINGMVHITGGAFTKLKEPLGDELDALIHKTDETKPQSIFYELSKRGVSDEEMYRTFNCGIGLVLSVSERSLEAILGEFAFGGFKPKVIGEVISGKGRVRIKSAFSRRGVML